MLAAGGLSPPPPPMLSSLTAHSSCVVAHKTTLRPRSLTSSPCVQFPGKENKRRSPVILLGSAMVRPVATNRKAFFIITTLRVGLWAGATGPQMYEFQCPSKTVAAEWMERIKKRADEYRKVNPNWEDALRRRIQEYRAAQAANAPVRLRCIARAGWRRIQ